MIVTILLTIWITCGVIYVSKEMAMPFSSSRSNLVILDFFFAPYFIVSDIIYKWKECKDLRKKYIKNL